MMGGFITTGVPTVMVGGIPIAVMGTSIVTPHPGPVPKIHPPNPVMVNCSQTVRVMNLAVAHVGSVDACLHPTLPHPNPLLATVRVGP
jgi:uncharacterized Zn-binding protein involved in type VI secretion